MKKPCVCVSVCVFQIRFIRNEDLVLLYRPFFWDYDHYNMKRQARSEELSFEIMTGLLFFLVSIWLCI